MSMNRKMKSPLLLFVAAAVAGVLYLADRPTPAPELITELDSGGSASIEDASRNAELIIRATLSGRPSAFTVDFPSAQVPDSGERLEVVTYTFGVREVLKGRGAPGDLVEAHLLVAVTGYGPYAHEVLEWRTPAYPFRQGSEYVIFLQERPAAERASSEKFLRPHLGFTGVYAIVNGDQVTFGDAPKVTIPGSAVSYPEGATIFGTTATLDQLRFAAATAVQDDGTEEQARELEAAVARARAVQGFVAQASPLASDAELIARAAALGIDGPLLGKSGALFCRKVEALLRDAIGRTVDLSCESPN